MAALLKRLSEDGRELRGTLLLATPIIAGNLSQMIMGLTDTLMIGRVGVVPLAAAALANTILHIVFVVGIGLMAAVSILVSHAFGAGDRHEIGEVLRRGLWIGGSAGFAMYLLIWAGLPLLGHLRQPPEVVAAAPTYLWLLAAALPFGMATLCFKNFSEAQDLPWPAFWSGLIAVLLNVLLNWVLIYGKLGAPALGLEGAGVATLISRIFGLGLLIVWLGLDRRLAGCWPRRWLKPPQLATVAKVFLLGFPVGLQIFIEVGAFSVASFFMGILGVIELAAHQIAITCAATTFMVPLGMSLAVVIRVGQAIGAGDAHRVAVISRSSIALVILISGVFATVFIGLGTRIASQFTDDAATIALAARLIAIAGIFQLVDAIQVVTIGALRGLKDVRAPTLILFVVYWLVCIPLGGVLAFSLNLGAEAIWAGLAVGLALAAAGLLVRLAAQLRQFAAHPPPLPANINPHTNP